MQLIVLGMHRSGTSVLARLLNMMGAYFGPEGISTGANKENPKGFWERRDVRNLNDFVLKSIDCDWNKVSEFSIKRLSESVLEGFRTRASSIVLELDSHRPWMMKEPRFCLLVELWKQHLEIPVFIHIHRNPLEVAQSLQKRNGIPLHAGIALWEKYNLSALKASQDMPRFLVSHHNLMCNPVAEVNHIYTQLLNYAVDGIREPTKREISAFVETELYRERVDEAKLLQHLNGMQARLFEAFSEGTLLESTKSTSLSDAARESLKEYEKNLEFAQSALLAQEIAKNKNTEIRNRHIEIEKELRSQIDQQLGNVKIAQQKATSIETELRNQQAQLEKELRQQIEQHAKAANSAQQLAYKTETDLKRMLAEQELEFTERIKQHIQSEEALKQQLRQQSQDILDTQAAARKEAVQLEEFHLQEARKAQQEFQKLQKTLENKLAAQASELANKTNTIKELDDKLGAEVREKAEIQKVATARLQDIRKLVRWLHALEFHLNAWRWRGGRMALGSFARLLGKRQAGIDADDTIKILADFKNWESMAEHNGKAGLAVIRNAENENRNLDRHVSLIQSSALFDADWYLKEYPDVKTNGMDPLVHFIRFGAKEKRNPSADFDSRWYLENYPDVAKSGINPLAHYILYGREELRLPKPPLQLKAPDDFCEEISIVITVFNALPDVKKCLNSVKNRRDGFKVDVIIVNDGSDQQTSTWLRSFCESHANFRLIEHRGNKGYTAAVNTGLKASTALFVVLLNSDTIVTHGWLKGLMGCMNSDRSIGIAGPLSSAASWQSVPLLYNTEGAFAVNELPNGMSPDMMAKIVARASSRSYPGLPFVNGFCFMIRREVMDSIGLMDEKNFPVGYGEENDYCIRASDAGFRLAIADDAYVFHSKSKSFGHERRKKLSQQGSEALKRKHTLSKFNALVNQVKNTESLDKIRASIQAEIRHNDFKSDRSSTTSPNVLFLLPVKGGSGGAHSVVQEVTAMRRLGTSVKIAVRDIDLNNLLEMYKDIVDAEDLFVGFKPDNLLLVSNGYDVVVGTIFHSMSLVKQIVDVNPHVLPAYYVQDYEPLFFTPESENWHAARDSYNLIPNTMLFAKTYWIANIVEQEHGVSVHKVSASIDHNVYKPQPHERREEVVIAAMIRPQTPRRGAERTMRLLSRIAKQASGNVTFSLFGCAENEPAFQNLQRDFKYQNHGVLTRPEVATVLASSDIFIDLSDYQAFGRTALEAMACGCAVMVTRHGGTDEYAVDEVNALVVDSLNEEECFNRLSMLLTDNEKMHQFKCEGPVTAGNFTALKAASSELDLFKKHLSEYRKMNPVVVKKRLVLVPSLRDDGLPTGSGYVRVLLPYSNASIWRNWEVFECGENELPRTGSADVAIIQNDGGDNSLSQTKAWLKAWREHGGKLIYEADDDFLDVKGLKNRSVKGDIEKLAQKVRWLAKEADVVTVSTSSLKTKFEQLNPKTELVPNLLDANKWKLNINRRPSQKIVAKLNPDAVYIGYIGTPTHDRDLEIVAEAMKMIEKEYGDKVEIEVFGGFQILSPLFGKRVGLPRNNEYNNFVEWLFMRANWDIGIIPLLDDDFNKYKSNLKFLEYAALDLAIVCSDVESYRNIAENEKNALIVKNTKEAWYLAVKDLIDHPEKRKRLTKQARADVSMEFTIENNADIYLNVLDRVTKRD